jgi:hypothetical protein
MLSRSHSTIFSPNERVQIPTDKRRGWEGREGKGRERKGKESGSLPASTISCGGKPGSRGKHVRKLNDYRHVPHLHPYGAVTNIECNPHRLELQTITQPLFECD